MTALLPALAAYLAARALGTYSTTTQYGPDTVGIVLGGLPAAPDRCVALSVTSAPESNTNEPYDLVYVRIRVRGTPDEAVSRQHAQAIYDALHGLGVTDLPGAVRVVNVVGTQGGPTWVGVDGNNRHEHVVNVRAEFRTDGRLPRP